MFSCCISFTIVHLNYMLLFSCVPLCFILFVCISLCRFSYGRFSLSVLCLCVFLFYLFYLWLYCLSYFLSELFLHLFSFLVGCYLFSISSSNYTNSCCQPLWSFTLWAVFTMPYCWINPCLFLSTKLCRPSTELSSRMHNRCRMR